jgi:hypothetical protein
MGSIHSRRLAALACALAVALGACSGGPAGAANDPAGVVQAALQAVNSGGLSKLSDYACAAKKNDLSALGGGGLGTLTQAGISQADLLAAMSMSFADLAVTQTAKTDTTATVHVTGNSTITFDKDKMKGIMKTMLTAQGQQVNDAMVDAAMAAMTAQFATPQKLDETVNVVNEGGKWLVCG